MSITNHFDLKFFTTLPPVGKSGSGITTFAVYSFLYKQMKIALVKRIVRDTLQDSSIEKWRKRAKA
jgi:hypothetical protein